MLMPDQWRAAGQNAASSHQAVKDSAQQPQHTNKYVRIASTARRRINGAQHVKTPRAAIQAVKDSAQQPQHTNKYVRIASTARRRINGAQQVFR
ncbi:hypothetical protein [Erwinia pyrifoliae]|uniref:hypothetical protein n=1 Tax=Erwinia pyrifoliae TaxID=79967 RepID=UPI001650DAD2|nr:hypothetical protein [Erwinia pyrifoliae]MCT2387788.1 hypothetical protein [Erwinia pyrifoliae]MCU8586044.1 hypothetical protein [Erwinia pyrifoliae]